MDALNLLLWSKTKEASKGQGQPAKVKRPWAERRGRKLIANATALPLAQMKARMKRINGR